MLRNGMHVEGARDYSISSDVWPGLGKVTEETGELGVVLGKIIAMGGNPIYEWGDRDLEAELHDEVADVLASTMWFAAMNDLDMERIGVRMARKMKLYDEWRANGEG